MLLRQKKGRSGEFIKRSGPLPTAPSGVWEMFSPNLLILARRWRCLRAPRESVVRVSVLYLIEWREAKHMCEMEAREGHMCVTFPSPDT